jgi:Uma2 family endonuclease
MAVAEPIEGTRYAPSADPPLPPKEALPTMYDLPSEDPEEPGVPDEFHYYQPQLLRETFRPPDFVPDRFFVGADINLYYDPGHTGWHKRPDWFAVLGASRLYRQQELRLSYVVWQEEVAPYLVVELLSPGTEDEDLGKSLWDVDGPPSKWVVYEQLLKVPYYVVYSRYNNELRAFGRVLGRYRELTLPDRRLWLPEARLGLGIWSGSFEGYQGDWLRCYDEDDHWLPTKSERQEQADRRVEESEQRAAQASQRAAQASQRAEQALRHAEQERRRAERLAERLRVLGVDPDREP